MADTWPPAPTFPIWPTPGWDPNNNPLTPHSQVIGDFEKEGDGFTGMVKTIALQAPISIRPIDTAAKEAPNYQVTSEGVNLGWARRRVTEQGDYLEVEIDDPSFHAPVRALLLKGADGDKHYLVWSRG